MILLIIPPEIQSIQRFRLFFTAELLQLFVISPISSISLIRRVIYCLLVELQAISRRINKNKKVPMYTSKN